MITIKNVVVYKWPQFKLLDLKKFAKTHKFAEGGNGGLVIRELFTIICV